MFAIGTVGQAAAIWIVCGGVRTVGGWLGESWDDLKSDGRAAAMAVAIVLMWLKQLISLKWVIKRRIDWSESIGLSITMAIIFVGYAIAAATQGPSSMSTLDGVGCALFLLGWGLSTGCELQRMWWKADPANKGKCYTGGLWAYSMHMNYFGETLLYIGLTMLTCVWWLGFLPLLMFLSFIFFHIPALDAYLLERYGDEFEQYAASTKKYVPFVY